MEIEFYIDPQTGLPHIYEHGVSEQEVIEVFQRSPVCLLARDGAMFALGHTSAGRYLKVVYREEGRVIMVITAYDLGGKALKAYRRRKRRRGR